MNKPMPRKLPTFKGYTFDTRLKEFRKMELGKLPEFIPFGSTEGRKLLEEMRKGGEKDGPVLPALR